MISAGDSDKPDVRPRAGARLSTMRGRLALTGRWRGALGLLLGLMLCGPVVSVLASPGVGRASKAVGRSDTAVAASRRQRLAELDVSAAAVKLLAGNVLAGTATVGNVGSARARSSTADVAWKSSDSGGLVQLGRFQVPALKPGQHHKARFQFDLPKGASGSYQVSVCADVLGQVQEHSKKDNCRDAGVVTISGSGVKASGPTSSEPSSPSGSPPGGSSPPPASPTPTTPASSPPSTVIDSGPSGLIGVSSVTFTFHGSDTNDTFQCSLDGAPWASCTSPQQYSSLAEGAHTFQVRAINAAGEMDATPASASFTVEATPPQTSITSAPSGRVPIGDVSISFTSTEAGGSFQCSLDGGAYSSCSSPDVVKDPAAGPHMFKVRATNQAGVKETAGSPSALWSSVEPQHDLCGTISSNTTIGPGYAARYVITCNVTVASGVTLTAQPGTIIKAEQFTQVSVEGALDAVGNEAEPVTFTSINDNTIGGSTGTGEPKAGEWDGIAGSVMSLVHTDVRFAGTAVELSGVSTLEDDDISGVQTGVVAGGEGAVSITGNVISAQDHAVYAPHTGSLSIVGNSLSELQTGEGAAVVETYNEYEVREDSQPVSIADNKISTAATEAAVYVTSSKLDFAALASNTISGPASALQVSVGGTVAESQTWSPTAFTWTIRHTFVYVPPSVKLTLAPGLTIKSSYDASCDETEVTSCLYGETYRPGASLWSEGTLDATGTASEPVTFTSINDNTIGGSTGTGEPKAGEWDGIYVTAEGSADLEHTTLEYAATALSVAEEAEVTIHGAILHSTVGISSHAYVEATDVNWGSSSGPAPFGTGTPIEGEVLAKPWVGYVAPPIPPEPPYEAPSEKFANCGDYFVVGVRGSGEEPQGNPPVYSSNQDGFGARDYNAYYGLKKVIEAYGVPESDFNLLGLRYRALGVEPAALINGEYEESIWEGVASLKEVLHERESECPSEPAILIGYSQGALVIHLALREMAESEPSMLSASHIAGVMLIADPAKVSGESEPVWEAANEPALPGSGIYKADGLWTKTDGSHQGPLPSAVTSRAISFCANHDIVCAPGFGSHIGIHTGYYQAGNLNAMGEWMAERILGRN
jgi:hypothetical protein